MPKIEMGFICTFVDRDVSGLKLSKMEWNRKVEMIQSYNNDFGRFKVIVLEEVESFDNQAWDMFFTQIELMPDNIENNLDFYIKVEKAFLKVKEDLEISFRADMRAEMFLEIIKQETA